MYRKGFWLILIEDDGSEMAVLARFSPGTTRSCRFARTSPLLVSADVTGFKVRQDGEILGWRRLPPDAPIRVPAHAGLLFP